MDISVNPHRFDGNAIIWAMTVSILLHVFVVVVVPNVNVPSKKEKSQVLRVELQQPAPPVPVAVPIVEPLPPIDIPEPPKPVKKEPKPIVKPVKKPIAPAPVKQTEVTPPPVVENMMPVAPPIEREPTTIVPTPAPIEPPPPPAPSQIDIDSAKNAYGNLLGRAIAKHKSYPKIAERRGWQGTVLLDLKIDSNGNVLSAVIRESSGYDALDKRALEMVEKASPFPAPPKVLQGLSFNISVPVAFKLLND